MPYYLKHHFDPMGGIDNLRPEQQDDGSVDHYELNYVQNVQAGDVIAEWVAGDDADAAKLGVPFEEKKFPAGKGTGVKRNDPDKLFAAVNGCVCYQDEKIVVRRTVTMPCDVDFRTGNVNFVGDLLVGGCIRSSFTVQGRNVTVQGQVESARVEALAQLNCRGGVKGGGKSFLESGENMHLAFCEFATLKSGGDVMVKGSMMHSDVYAGKRLAVGGRLTGGTIHCHEYMYVGDQLGGGLDSETVIVLGYAPSMLYADADYNRRIKSLYANISRYERQLKKKDANTAELEPALASAQRELDLLKLLKVKLWEGISGTETVKNCKILVPGVVKPGVEISIGNAYLKVDDFLEDVYFHYDRGEVKIGASAKKLKK